MQATDMTSVLQTSKETMVTRNKLAKQNINSQTMKTLSQLLLRPNITITTKSILLKTFNNNSIKGDLPTLGLTDTPSESGSLNGTNPIKKSKSVTSEVKVKKVARSKSLVVEKSKEFYPDKVKRNLPTKKVVLKPKHQYKVVATTNKRKRGIPHRELESPPPEEEPELTMSELVRLADEEGMDDEDLMEILTCPSPVWWEDDDHTEEIKIRFHEANEQDTVTENDSDTQILASNNTEEYTKYTKNRRVTLKQLHESSKADISFFQKYYDKKSKLENVLGSIKNKKARISEPNERIGESNDVVDGKVRKYSTGGLSDASLNEEELIKNLESIQIPVQKHNNNHEEANKAKANPTDGTEIEITDKRIFKKREKKPTRKVGKSKKNNKQDKGNNERIIEIQSEGQVRSFKAVPIELPPLTMNPFMNLPMELDSISDSNVQYLYDNEDDTTESKVDEHKSVIESKDELVTIYRIVPTEHTDKEDQIKMNLANKSAEKSIENSQMNLDINLVSIKPGKNSTKPKRSEMNSIEPPANPNVNLEVKKISPIDSNKSPEKSVTNLTENTESEMNSIKSTDKLIINSNENIDIAVSSKETPEKSTVNSEGNSIKINSFYKKKKFANRNAKTLNKIKGMDWQINEKITNLFGNLNAVEANKPIVTQFKYIRGRGRNKRKKEQPPNTTINYCPKCFTVFESNDICVYCT